MPNNLHENAPESNVLQRRLAAARDKAEREARAAAPAAPSLPASNAKAKARLASVLASAAPAAADFAGWVGELPVDVQSPLCEPLNAPPCPAENAADAALEAHVEDERLLAEQGADAYSDLARQHLEVVRERARSIGFKRDMQAQCDATANLEAEPLPDRVARHVWVWVRVLILGSFIERAFVLMQIRATYGSVELGRMLAIAFEPLGGGGYRYDWSDEIARRQFARLVMTRSTMRVVRLQSVNGSPSKRLVHAAFRLPQALFKRALTRASGVPFSRRTHSRDAKRLHMLGLRIVRPPADRVPKNEVGPSGQNCNRYLLERVRRRASRKSAPERIGGTLSSTGEHALWADLGHHAELQRIERRPRGARMAESMRRKRRDAELAAAVVGPPPTTQ